jgi:hypothetical protein
VLLPLILYRFRNDSEKGEFFVIIETTQTESEDSFMADLLQIRAKNGNGLTWQFIDESMAAHKVSLDQPATVAVNDGDVWQVELISTSTDSKTKKKIAVVRLIAKVLEVKAWQKLAALPDHWIEPVDLKFILGWLHSGTDIVLIGPKGTGKTTIGFAIAKALGWQEPCKVDVYTIRRTTDLFGTDAARDGSTLFVRSGFLDYIERAEISHKQGLDTHFIVVLDELNRVHAKVNESMHGLFDDTRQVTVTTTEGSRIIRLPPNLHSIGTMNMGAEYLGTHGLDDALKDRFQPIKIRRMPLDVETARLVSETGIAESEALKIIQVADVLRAACDGGQLSFAPSYRACRNVARALRFGADFKSAVIKGFLGWYDGELTLNDKGEPTNPSSEAAKAYSALRMRGIK